MARARVALLDFDGVISDSANVHVAAWERTFGELGWPLDSLRADRAAEIDDRAFLEEALRGFGFEAGDADLEGWLRRKRALADAMLRQNPRGCPGIGALVEGLRARGVVLGVVTAGWRDTALAALEGLGLRERFATVVGKEDAARTKPDPAPYRLALERLGFEAREGVAVEDSPTGLASASGAGLRCVAVAHTRASGDWHRPHPCLPDFFDTEAAIAAILGVGLEEGDR